MREEHFPTRTPIELHCALSSGELIVGTGDEDTVTVAISGAPRLVDALRVELVGDRLTVAEPSLSFRDLLGAGRRELQVTATIPHDSSVTATTASGNATLDGRFAGVQLQTASGDLRITGEVGGDVTVKSASGDVDVADIGGDLDVRSASGDLRVESVAGSVTAKSMSGDVRIAVLRAGTVSAQSASGDITLGVQSGSVVDLEATSASGVLTSEVPLADAPEADDDGPRLVIRAATASGDVRILRATTAAPQPAELL